MNEVTALLEIGGGFLVAEWLKHPTRQIRRWKPLTGLPSQVCVTK